MKETKKQKKINKITANQKVATRTDFMYIKGITLIALVITIIVMLILASVAINLSLGENGLFVRAKNAAKQYEKAEIKETLESAILDIQMDNDMKISIKDIIEQLPIKCDGSNWIDIDNEEPLGEYKGYEFKVKSDYTVEVLSKTKEERPQITNIKVEIQGTIPKTASIIVTVLSPNGKTINSVIEEKSKTTLVINEDGTYVLSNITANGIYMIKVIDFDGKTTIKSVQINNLKTVVTVNYEEGGTAQGSGEFEKGENIQLKAIANENFKFKGWYVGETEISKENPLMYEVKETITITAKFEREYYTITKDIGQGCSINNDISRIKTGEKYEAIISIPDTENYYFKTLKVTMGGSEVSINQDTKEIRINEVTGDVVITAKAGHILNLIKSGVLINSNYKMHNVESTSYGKQMNGYVEFNLMEPTSGDKGPCVYWEIDSGERIYTQIFCRLKIIYAGSYYRAGSALVVANQLGTGTWDESYVTRSSSLATNDG